MVEVKAGQWWTDKGSVAGRHRLRIWGLTRTEKVVCELSDGTVSTLGMDYFLKFKEHLPECTSFEWVPEVYPQYRETYMPNVWAFVRLDSPTQHAYVRLDGKEDPQQNFNAGWSNVNDRIKLTEAEALARIVKPEPKTRMVKVHTVLYDRPRQTGEGVVVLSDDSFPEINQTWKNCRILKTEEFEVTCE